MKNKNILIMVFISFGFLFSQTVFADTTINLKIKTNTSSIFDQEIIVIPCDSDSNLDTPDEITAYCALLQSGISSDWVGLWVNSIGGVLNNDGENGIYWMWLANLNIDNCPTCSYSLSAKQYVLQNNDNILFYYNTNPLDIIVDKENPKPGESIKIIGKELGLDSFWNPIWSNALGSKVVINGVEHDLDSNGEFIYEVVNSDTISLKIQKDGFIDSTELSIKPEEIRRSSGSSGSHTVDFTKTIIIPKTFSKEGALKFLEINQKADGSFGDSLYTDWVAIAIGAVDDNIIKEKLIKYYKENNLESNLITDNERHAMALMSLGINPYNETKINYIKKIIDSFDGEQFGDKTLVNDDIFALIVFKNAGYGVNDELIIKDINYIISKQDKDGSWGSIDMTAASIQALRSFENIIGVNDAILKSEKYLISNQEEDFGFGNFFSTSWVLQSLYTNEQILKSEKYLAFKQEIDGGLESVEIDLNTRIWATSYAIPAILHKPWSEILNNFPKQEIQVSPRQDLGEDKTDEIKKINKEIIKKSVKILEDKVKKENLIEDNKLSQNNKIQSKASRVWGMFKVPFSWLLVKLGF